MKKSPRLHKKRPATRRKKRLKRRQRLSVQQRLARLAKREQALANLVAALNQFPISVTGAVEPEPEAPPHLPELGRALLDVRVNSQEYPQRFGWLQPRVQQKLSVTASVSLPQPLSSARSVGTAVAHREAALLWEVPHQRVWPLAPVGCRMTLPASMPQVVITHARGSILSPVTPGSPYVVAQPTFSCSITLKQPPAKLFCQEGLLIPPQSSGYPARGWKGTYRMAPAAAVDPDLRADNPPGAEQSSSESIKGRVGRKVIFKEYLRETARLYQSSKYLRKTADFIRKSSRPDKKPSLGIVLNRAKKQRQLGQTGGSILRLRGWSPADDTGLGMKQVKLLGRKHLGSFHWPSISRSDGQLWLRESRAVSSTDRHRQLVTLIPPVAVPRREPPSVQLSPTVVVNPDLRADNPPEAEQSSSDDEKGITWDKVFGAKKHPREARTRRATEDSSDDELGAEPDSFDDEKENTGQGRFEVEGESAEAIKARQADSCSICWVLNLLNGEQPVPERVSCEDLVEHLQFVQEIAALLPLDLGYDDHKGLRYEIPHSWLASLPNRRPFWDRSWI